MVDRPKKPGKGRDSYEVGYGRPPSAHRFQPGKSGNPKGRPKVSKDLDALIEEELLARVAVNENGKRRLITKEQAIAKQVVNKAASGEMRSFRHVTEVKARLAALRGKESHWEEAGKVWNPDSTTAW